MSKVSIHNGCIFQKVSFLILAFVVLVCLPHDLWAQCQACKSTVESNMADGGSAGNGLNTGIIYLLSTPYIMALAIGGVFFFKHQHKKRLENG